MRYYTDLLHLVILNNLQNINVELIEEKVPQSERLINSARRQMKVLKDNKNIKKLELLQKQVNEELLID